MTGEPPSQAHEAKKTLLQLLAKTVPQAAPPFHSEEA